VIGEQPRKGCTRKLASLIGVEDLGRAVLGNRFLEGVCAEQQNTMSIEIDTRQVSTLRQYQSITAAK
jgi:hypothetical protein